MYQDLIDKDITVHSKYGNSHRGILREVNEANETVYLQFEVGIDRLFIGGGAIYAITVHGISPTNLQGE